MTVAALLGDISELLLRVQVVAKTTLVLVKQRLGMVVVVQHAPRANLDRLQSCDHIANPQKARRREHGQILLTPLAATQTRLNFVEDQTKAGS